MWDDNPTFQAHATCWPARYNRSMRAITVSSSHLDNFLCLSNLGLQTCDQVGLLLQLLLKLLDLLLEGLQSTDTHEADCQKPIQLVLQLTTCQNLWQRNCYYCTISTSHHHDHRQPQTISTRTAATTQRQTSLQLRGQKVVWK